MKVVEARGLGEEPIIEIGKEIGKLQYVLEDWFEINP